MSHESDWTKNIKSPSPPHNVFAYFIPVLMWSWQRHTWYDPPMYCSPDSFLLSACGPVPGVEVALHGGVQEDVELPVAEVWRAYAVARVVVVGGRVAVARLVAKVDLLVAAQERHCLYALGSPGFQKEQRKISQIFRFLKLAKDHLFQWQTPYQTAPRLPALPSIWSTKSVPKPAARSKLVLYRNSVLCPRKYIVKYALEDSIPEGNVTSLGLTPDKGRDDVQAINGGAEATRGRVEESTSCHSVWWLQIYFLSTWI